MLAKKWSNPLQNLVLLSIPGLAMLDCVNYSLVVRLDEEVSIRIRISQVDCKEYSQLNSDNFGSWLSLFHLGLSFQASQPLSKMILIPHDDEVLTQNSTKEIGGGLEIREPQNLEESSACHQEMSARMAGLGECLTNGDEND